MQDNPVGIAVGQCAFGMGAITDRIGQLFGPDGKLARVGDELRGDGGGHRVQHLGRDADAEVERDPVQDLAVLGPGEAFAQQAIGVPDGPGGAGRAVHE